MRITSGIDGFDRLVEGGIPEHSVVLLTGDVGLGKTIFGLQFLCTAEEPGVFVSFEESIEQLKETAGTFGWDTGRLEREKKLKFVKIDPYRFEDVLDVVENSMREVKARRVVLDSISALGVHLRETAELRNTIVQIGAIMRKDKCTALLISEKPRDALSRFGMEEFVSDGVVVLQRAAAGSGYRNMLGIYKMRLTNHSKKMHSYEITEEGVVVGGEEEA